MTAMEESFTLSEVYNYYESEMDSPSESEIDPRVGIVFSPTNEETIQILEYKSSHPDYKFDAISEVNIYKFEPYELPGRGAIESDGKFYFFCTLNPLDASGGRFNRATGTGYWKKTGKKFPIMVKGTHEEIGCKRTLVFYKRFPGGYEERTNWVMHEYSANNNPKDLVVCKIKEKKEKRKKEKKEDKKRGSSTKYENKRTKKRLISSNDEGQPSHCVAFGNGNHMTEQSSLEMQQLSSCHLISTSTHHDGTEIISPERQLPPSCYLISIPTSDGMEDTSQVDTMPLEDPNSLNGSTLLHQTSLSIQSPILPEQGLSYSSVSSNENDGLNSPFAINSDFLPQFPLAAQDEFLYPDFPLAALDEFLYSDFHQLLGEETGHTTYLSFATPTY